MRDDCMCFTFTRLARLPPCTSCLKWKTEDKRCILSHSDSLCEFHFFLLWAEKVDNSTERRLILQRHNENAFHLCLLLSVTYLVLGHYDWLHRHSDPGGVAVIILMRSATPFVQPEFILPPPLTVSVCVCSFVLRRTLQLWWPVQSSSHTATPSVSTESLLCYVRWKK